MNFVSKIIKFYADSGVKRGDAVLVSSDFTGAGLVMRHEDMLMKKKPSSLEFYMSQVVERLKDLVGDNGTLLFPTYNWGFCKNIEWNQKETLGETGALSNYTLSLEGFKRTKHPIYSFSVWGKDRDFLCSLENVDAFGADSPFSYLFHNGGKNISLGTDNYHTFHHYVEECKGVPYRYIKKFTARYIMGDIDEKRTYSMYVRQLEPQEAININVTSIDLLDINKAIIRSKVDGVIVECVDCRKSFNAIANEIVNNGAQRLVRFE